MLRELKFVQGAVAKKDLIPAMTHFKIEGGHVRSYNGAMAISSPIAFDIDCVPKADQLVKAIQQCEDTIQLSMTAGGRLRIQSGNFRAFCETVDHDTAHPMPAGDEVHFNGEKMLDACKTLLPFIGDDASRPWTNGLLLMGHSAFATNNVIVLEYWLGSPFPEIVNIPRNCIRELVRVDEPPTHMQYDERSITFHYEDQRWIRSQLLETTWPDVAKILNKESSPKPLPDGLFEGIETLKSLEGVSASIYFQDGLLRTSLEEFTGGVYEVPGINFEGKYNVAIFNLLKGVIDRADFTTYPEPCMLFGPNVRGAIIGMKM